MTKPTLLALGLVVALAAAPVAGADKLRTMDAAARTEMNALGDKALAGDEAALWTLKTTANECRVTRSSPCPTYSADTSRAAAAAANLGWLHWTKGAFGPDEKNKGMVFYAQAARLGAPSGLYQIADCLRAVCVTADVQPAVSRELNSALAPALWSGSKYERLKEVSALFGKAANSGLTAAAVEKTKVDFELVGLARTALDNWDDGTLAIYSHLHGIIGVSKTGLQTNPTDEQRRALENALVSAQAQAGQLESEAAAARQRRQGGPGASPASSTAAEPVSKGANYDADKNRARSCIAESNDLKSWRRDLDDWSRDMKAWDKELTETRRDLELYYRNDTALRNSYNADVDAFNAEGREYDAEQSGYNDAADAYNGRCKGSFNSYAIKEECTGSAADSRFCRAFR